MRFTVCAVVAAATAVSAQSSTIVPAPVASNSPEGASYVATLPEKGTVRGSITGISGPNGEGTKFQISVSGLPAEGGPFMYHIHEKPVPANGNCSGTGAHLDPYKRGEVPPCDPQKKETCQTGDLSGKFRNLTGPADSDSPSSSICPTRRASRAPTSRCRTAALPFPRRLSRRAATPCLPVSAATTLPISPPAQALAMLSLLRHPRSRPLLSLPAALLGWWSRVPVPSLEPLP
ncbi:uncharacterized protein EI97DRAFT_433486 [Westerdykella ornata]|uniref:Uncharacterized protein n=1 Tax=Westerdykella ornata TaxID=318751 RepID=A0A6A6JIY4_WESOR|nr:uncharacterized protein EI97DRAFT_433486 [Westerdykella ornata]KAF2276073.1 hypothetical protein EI97DRAFT_433486 [Westerdykella ornata]